MSDLDLPEWIHLPEDKEKSRPEGRLHEEDRYILWALALVVVFTLLASWAQH